MEFTIKGPFKDNIYNLTRKIGYFFEGKEEAKGELVFARPLRGYPRFHLFLRVDQEGNKIIFDLHLDQKAPIYKGVAAHSAEYGSEVVKKEAERIKETIKKEIRL